MATRLTHPGVRAGGDLNRAILRTGRSLARSTARTTPLVLGVVFLGCGDGEPTGPVLDEPSTDEPSTVVTTIADDGPGSLRQVVAEAEPGAVIRFDTEGVFGSPQKIELDEDIVLARDVSIVGPGADLLTVGARNLSRVFRIEGGADVAISELTVTEGVAPFQNIDFLGTPRTARLGGCVFVANGSELTLDAVVVTGCVLPLDVDLPAGAGIANLEGTLTVRDSRIDGNSAPLGAGVAALALGPTEAATTTIEGGSVSGSEGGGVFSVRGSLLVRSSAMRDNDVGVLAFGGGSVTLEDLTIENHGIVGVSIEDGVRGFIRRGVVVGNPGTGIRSSGALTIESTTISNNATSSGSGVRISGGSAVISGSLVAGNGAIGTDPGRTLRGGGISVGGSSTRLQVLDSTRIEDNQANEGGGIHVSSGRLTIRESTISSNAANEGGGIFADRADVLLDAAAIVENEARDGSGGGIRFTASERAELTIRSGSRVSGNSATLDGGGIDLSGSDAKATIEDGDVTDNLAGRFGGGIRVGDGVLEMLGASGVERNLAERGGGLHLTQGRIEISESAVVVANRANADGGGLNLRSGTLRVEATFCVILGNEADFDDDGDGRGGGIFRSSSVNLQVPAQRVCLNDPDDIASG